MKDHELTALRSVVDVGSIVNLYIHITGPYLGDHTILDFLFELFKVSFWVYLDPGNIDPEEGTSLNIDTETCFLRNKTRGMLCGGGNKKKDWMLLIKTAVKLLELPKCAVEILFNKTYAD